MIVWQTWRFNVEMCNKAKLTKHHIDFRQAKVGDIESIVAMLADDPLGEQRED